MLGHVVFTGDGRAQPADTTPGALTSGALTYAADTIVEGTLRRVGEPDMEISHAQQALSWIQYRADIGAAGPAPPLPQLPVPPPAQVAQVGAFVPYTAVWPAVLHGARYADIVTQGGVAGAAFPVPAPGAAPPPPLALNDPFVLALQGARAAEASYLQRDARTLRDADFAAAGAAFPAPVQAAMIVTSNLLSAAAGAAGVRATLGSPQFTNAMLTLLDVGDAPPPAAAPGAPHVYMIADFFVAEDAAALAKGLAERQQAALRAGQPASAQATLHAAGLSVAGAAPVTLSVPMWGDIAGGVVARNTLLTNAAGAPPVPVPERAALQVELVNQRRALEILLATAPAGHDAVIHGTVTTALNVLTNLAPPWRPGAPVAGALAPGIGVIFYIGCSDAKNSGRLYATGTTASSNLGYLHATSGHGTASTSFGFIARVRRVLGVATARLAIDRSAGAPFGATQADHFIREMRMGVGRRGGGVRRAQS